LDPYAPFRYSNYRYLLGGNVIANFGLQMVSVAVSWDLYQQTRSPLVLGNVGLAQVIPFVVFALWAGDFADRHDRRLIMVRTQLLLAAAACLLLFASGSILLLYAYLFLAATARAFQGPARSASIPNVVPPEALREAITWNSSTFEIANVSGPAVAGLLIAVAGSKVVYATQLICSLLALLCFVRLRLPPVQTASGVASRQSLLEGARFLRDNPLILSAISLDLLAVLFGGATALLPIFAAEVLHTGANGLGWLRASPAIGAFLMAFVLTHSLRIRRAGLALLVSVAGFGAATIVFGLSRSFLLSIAMLVLVGGLDNVSVVLRNSLLQTKTPDWLRGRVLAVNSIFISCSNQLGAVESGWAAALLGTTTSVVAGGMATLLVTALFALKSPSLRRWETV
jgi:MFS family permease